MSLDENISHCFREYPKMKRRIEILETENQRLQAEVARLSGIAPELPPCPPTGAGMPRYGVRWNGPTEPLAVPMDDGYWTPWHLADHIRRTATEAALRWAWEEMPRIGVGHNEWITRGLAALLGEGEK